MADLLKGTWVFDYPTYPDDNQNQAHIADWKVKITSNGENFDGIRLRYSNIDHKGTMYIGYFVMDGDEKIFTPVFTYVEVAREYYTIEVTSSYDEVANASELVRALTARATFTPAEDSGGGGTGGGEGGTGEVIGENIEIPMTSPKGVLLKTDGKLCEINIVVKPELEEATITENGTYTPSKVGYSKVSVNVAAESAPPNIQPLTITENGTYTANGDIDGYSPITVEVAASGGGDPLDACIEGGRAEVNMPNATKLKQYAFYKDTTLTKASMPSATEIGQYAFQDCTKLASVSLSNALQYIRADVFNGCTNLVLSELPNSLKSIGGRAFRNCAKVALKSLPSGVSYYNTLVFYGCSALAITEIPSEVSAIEANVFGNCTGITSISFKGTPVGTINANAFGGCTNLTTINVPWAEGAKPNAPWGATNATINYNYTGG